MGETEMGSTGKSDMGEHDVAPRAADQRDGELLGRVLAAAFADDPVMSWAFADDVRVQRLTTIFTMMGTHGYLELGASTVLPGGDGGALWAPQGKSFDRERFFVEHAEQFLTEMEGDVDRIGAVGDAMSEVHPTDDHWYLFAIGIVPEAQGRGLGGVLLAHTLEQVDAAGQAAYLEATSPRSRVLYERFGFEVVAEIRPADAPPLWAMWRPPA